MSSKMGIMTKLYEQNVTGQMTEIEQNVLKGKLSGFMLTLSMMVLTEDIIFSDDVKFKIPIVVDVYEKYFKHRQQTSFIRQLNMYGFIKVKTEGLNDPMEYMCSKGLFKRSTPSQWKNITRKVVGKKRKHDIESVGESLAKKQKTENPEINEVLLDKNPEINEVLLDENTEIKEDVSKLQVWTYVDRSVIVLKGDPSVCDVSLSVTNLGMTSVSVDNIEIKSVLMWIYVDRFESELFVDV
jgi:hypothetical protein